LANAIRQVYKNILNGKEEIKLSMLGGGMIVYVKNLKRMSNYSKVAGFVSYRLIYKLSDFAVY
jgi:hypothetical protein